MDNVADGALQCVGVGVARKPLFRGIEVIPAGVHGALPVDTDDVAHARSHEHLADGHPRGTDARDDNLDRLVFLIDEAKRVL